MPTHMHAHPYVHTVGAYQLNSEKGRRKHERHKFACMHAGGETSPVSFEDIGGTRRARRVTMPLSGACGALAYTTTKVAKKVCSVQSSCLAKVAKKVRSAQSSCSQSSTGGPMEARGNSLSNAMAILSDASDEEDKIRCGYSGRLDNSVRLLCQARSSADDPMEARGDSLSNAIKILSDTSDEEDEIRCGYSFQLDSSVRF